jgi:hypothetical protein
LRRLTQALVRGGAAAGQYAERRARWQREHDTIVASLRAAEANAPRSGAVDPLYLCRCLREIMPADTIYIDETVVYANLVQAHLPWTMPQSFFRTPTGLGQGLGVGLGVKLAAPDRPVVVLTGDGSFLYSPALAAFGAAKANKLPILALIFNNREYKSMKRNHLALYPNGLAKQTGIHHGNKIDSLDYAELAKAFGGFGRRVEDAADLPGAIDEASPRSTPDDRDLDVCWRARMASTHGPADRSRRRRPLGVRLWIADVATRLRLSRPDRSAVDRRASRVVRLLVRAPWHAGKAGPCAGARSRRRLPRHRVPGCGRQAGRDRGLSACARAGDHGLSRIRPAGAPQSRS